ncbi:MAG: hypothetical protein OXF26_12105 [Alphaproteobacteria bacterium]|nr:hypothetical protein [Alphaproteobacteria bacterium]
MKLISQYKSALQVCENKLIEMSTERQYRGMEKVYQEALVEVLEKNRRKVRREVLLDKICGQVVDDRSRGYVDIVVEDKNSNVHGIEIKLVQLPREDKYKLGPSQSLYDIGQITGDFLRLEGARRLTSFDCVIVLHGALLSVYGTSRSLLREFHNRMFVDFETSKIAGELKTQKNLPLRMEQERLIKQLGLDQPFTPSTKSMHAQTVKNLGLITIPGPIP